MTRLNSVEELEALMCELADLKNDGEIVVRTCSTGCRALGASSVHDRLVIEIEAAGMSDRVRILQTGCQGMCAKAPVISIDPGDIMYGEATPDDVSEIVERTLGMGEVIDRLCCAREADGRGVSKREELPFFKQQQCNVLAKCGRIDPKNIDDYIAVGGYASLSKVLRENDPVGVIKTISASGLRGRGGAGFPAGVKWDLCRKEIGDQKYLICNADEGDPGAFMDRAVLEGDPHAVLEGMLIAAFAIGANQGYIYVRAEYPIAVEHLGIAIAQAHERGVLGYNILGTGYAFDIEIREGAGAFVCGEETALIASIEGKRGTPRVRPPFPAQSGLFGKPTIINNVETLANVPLVIRLGAEGYAATGTESSSGTKIFALAGKVVNTGLVEVPMGTTLRQIVYDIGGGILRGRDFKAAQTGGPSGGCVPASALDMPIDYESLKALGTIMGSGGLIVMDEATCMVDMACYFLQFTQDESCGKCVPCRVGTKQMLGILTRMTEGQASMVDLQVLEELAGGIGESALCGLGKTAPNPVLSTLRYFRDEYLAHVIDKHCPAGVCKSLVRSPCQNACPAGVNVPQYVALVGKGECQRAADLVRLRNPFASTCGRLCTHPCETFCRRGDVDDSVAIMRLKRVATDNAPELGNGRLKDGVDETGKKVAVVGGGPSGLSAAYFLALRGHAVTVYEAQPEAGGMMFVGAPAYRMPREAVARDVAYIQQFGVSIVTGTRVGVDVPLADLIDGNDAVYIAVGAHQGVRLDVPGGDAVGVHDGVTFLRDLNLGQPPPVGRRVAVVGGGNVAMDAARSALRLGAEKVTVLYRRTEAEMPAHPEEVEEALEERIEIQYLCAPVAVETEGDAVTGLRLVRMRLGQAEASGRRRPVPVEGSEFLFECDTVIQAIGQTVDASFLVNGKLKTTRGGRLEADGRTCQTGIENVFSGGDCSVGGGTVVQAVATGQRAATVIDRYLGGSGELPLNSDPLAETLRLPEEGARQGHRPEPSLTAAPGRCRTFEEVQLSDGTERAALEAARCLRCDLVPW